MIPSLFWFLQALLFEGKKKCVPVARGSTHKDNAASGRSFACDVASRRAAIKVLQRFSSRCFSPLKGEMEGGDEVCFGED